MHVKSVDSQELRTLLGSREFLVNKLRDHENEIRGLLRPIWPQGWTGHGLWLRGTQFLELVEDRPRLRLCMEALLSAREAIMRQLAGLHGELLRVTKNDELCVRFMGIPGVGPVTALAFKTAVDRPDRFRRSSDVGAHLGLTPRQHQSGEIDRRGRIAKNGDGLTRTALFAAANVMLTRSTQWTSLKHWVSRSPSAARSRRRRWQWPGSLPFIMHRMWKDGTSFRWTTKEA